MKSYDFYLNHVQNRWFFVFSGCFVYEKSYFRASKSRKYGFIMIRFFGCHRIGLFWRLLGARLLVGRLEGAPPTAFLPSEVAAPLPLFRLRVS